jgi:hypothetical protein
MEKKGNLRYDPNSVRVISGKEEGWEISSWSNNKFTENIGEGTYRCKSKLTPSAAAVVVGCSQVN